MFVLSVSYLVPLEQADVLLPEHVQWVEQHYADGTFLLSGRKVPRTGGVIVATGDDRERIEKLVAQDPFVQHRVAEYEITEFLATKTSSELERYRQEQP